MAINLADGYAELRSHVGHSIECVGYGGTRTPIIAGGEVVGYDRRYANVAIECVDCSVVLLDFDRP